MSTPVTGFLIYKNFVISCMTGIKRLANKEEIRLADGEEITPADVESKGPADKKKKMLADVEGLINTKASADVKDFIVIYYIHQY